MSFHTYSTSIRGFDETVNLISKWKLQSHCDRKLTLCSPISLHFVTAQGQFKQHNNPSSFGYIISCQVHHDRSVVLDNYCQLATTFKYRLQKRDTSPMPNSTEHQETNIKHTTEHVPLSVAMLLVWVTPRPSKLPSLLQSDQQVLMHLQNSTRTSNSFFTQCNSHFQII